MTDLTRKVAVKSRSRGKVVYKIDALRISRTWNRPGDIINIPIDELIELKTVRGGKVLLDKYLIIEDEEAKALLYDYELPPEYDYGEVEVDYLLHKGTNEQLMDALDYAPEGVLFMIKSMAIKNKPDTTAKVEAINKKFNIDLMSIIKNAEIDESVEEEVITPRRSEPVKIVTPSKYKVVEPKDN